MVKLSEKESFMRRLPVLLSLSILLLSGCSSTGYKITYNTVPEAASVICNGKNEGYSPVTLNYSPDENTKNSGVMKTVPCTAIWSSGARKDFGNIWDLNKFPNGVMQTLQRPDVDGYSQDAEFALRVQQMKQQKSAADSAAFQRSLDSLNRQIRDMTPKTTFTNCNGTYGGVNCTSTTY
jgi:hypothetical protein